MSNPRKYFPHGSVVFATSSLEQGLLLLSNPLSQCIVKSCLARALELFPVKLCHFIVHANHFHMVYVVEDPSNACKFIGYFKAEVAHRMNAVFSWNKRTVWCDGYDSPVVLSPVRTLMAIAYLYSNPAKDGQEESIDRFPGLSSWKMFKTNALKTNWKFIRRPAYRHLAKDAHTLAGYTREAERILNETKDQLEFQIQPNAWLDAFGISDSAQQEEWNERLIQRIRKLEDRASKIRQEKNRPVVGRNRMLAQKMTLNHKSNRIGKRMWCLSERRFDRVAFIDHLKGLIALAKLVFAAWHLGDYSEPFPAGLFPPSMPKLVEPLAVG